MILEMQAAYNLPSTTVSTVTIAQHCIPPNICNSASTPLNFVYPFLCHILDIQIIFAVVSPQNQTKLTSKVCVSNYTKLNDVQYTHCKVKYNSPKPVNAVESSRDSRRVMKVVVGTT